MAATRGKLSIRNRISSSGGSKPRENGTLEGPAVSEAEGEGEEAAEAVGDEAREDAGQPDEEGSNKFEVSGGERGRGWGQRGRRMMGAS